MKILTLIIAVSLLSACTLGPKPGHYDCLKNAWVYGPDKPYWQEKEDRIACNQRDAAEAKVKCAELKQKYNYDCTPSELRLVGNNGGTTPMGTVPLSISISGR